MESSPKDEHHACAEKLQVAQHSRRLLMNSLNHITDFDAAIQQALDENRDAINKTCTYLETHERLLSETRRDQERIRRSFQEMENVFTQAEDRIAKYLDALKDDRQRLQSRQQNLEGLSERNHRNTNDLMRLIVNEDAPSNAGPSSMKRPADRSKAAISNLLSEPEEDTATPVQKRPRIDLQDDTPVRPKSSMATSSFRLLSKPYDSVPSGSNTQRETQIMKPSYASSTTLMRSSGSTSPRSSASSMLVDASPLARPQSLNPRASFRVKVTEAARPHEFKPYDVSNASDKKTDPPLAPRHERVCTGCKQMGRRRDGKCIEKWGPGPEGPGTLCGKCQRAYRSKRSNQDG